LGQTTYGHLRGDAGQNRSHTATGAAASLVLEGASIHGMTLSGAVWGLAALAGLPELRPKNPARIVAV